MANKKQDIEEIFFPYYVNQGRLLDIYAILNEGYSEYSEIITAINNEKKQNDSAEINTNAGFKLFNFGGSVSAGSENLDGIKSENKEKKVQTVTSVLSLVKKELNKRGYLCDMESVKAGNYICIPVVLSINWIKILMEELSDLVKLMDNIIKISPDLKREVSLPDKKEIQNVQNTLKVLFGGEEIVFQTEKYAIIGNIVEENLYQATKPDIIGTELKCLAQVKRVYPNGTELMKNTIFTKIKDAKMKKSFIEAMMGLSNQETYDFDVVAIPSIHGKPVYQIEIIALYQ